ncbi:hypothetical protein BJ742DRAFT_803292 [Cladochytrium replicatum]|nr:hypothetical protein BJ742DRAFT_803292 [Cladochytrium replicatum]
MASNGSAGRPGKNFYHEQEHHHHTSFLSTPSKTDDTAYSGEHHPASSYNETLPHYPPEPTPHVVDIPDNRKKRRPAPPNKNLFSLSLPDAPKVAHDTRIVTMAAVCSAIFGFSTLFGCFAFTRTKKISFAAGLSIGLPLSGLLNLGIFALLYVVKHTTLKGWAFFFVVKGVIDIVVGACTAGEYLRLKTMPREGTGRGSRGRSGRAHRGIDPPGESDDKIVTLKCAEHLYRRWWIMLLVL